MDYRQKTLAHPVEVKGVALHSGLEVEAHLLPADVGTGIVFRRTDLAEQPEILAKPHGVINTQLCTQLAGADPRHSVSTIEHLMAAFHVLGVTNVIVAVDGPELPVLDGSSQPWLDAMDTVEICSQDAVIAPLVVVAPTTVEEGNRTVTAQPADTLILDVELDYGRPEALPVERATLEISEEIFRAELAKARTFCFESDVEAMRSVGLAKGGSLENAVVMGEQGILNPDGWRYTNGMSEAMRHKMLDIIGDLYLAGRPVHGHFTFKYPGHGLNNQILRKLV